MSQHLTEEEHHERMEEQGRRKAAKGEEILVPTSKGIMEIEALFKYYHGTQLTQDASPSQIRSRFLFLANKFAEAQMEKAISGKQIGKREVALWNCILEMLRKEIQVAESVNISLCNERRVLGIYT